MSKKESNVFDTKFKVTKYQSPKYERASTDLVSDLNGMFKEALLNDPKYGKVFKEKLNFKEEGQTMANNTGAYTTLLQQMIHTAMLDDPIIKKAESLVFINDDMVKNAGYGAYQIPRGDPTIAVEVAEGAVVNYFEEGTEPIVVTPRKYIAATKITWEVKKRGMGALMNFILGKAKDALVRKRVSNIVNGIAAGAGTTVNGGMSYENFLKARAAVVNATALNGEKYNFTPTDFIISGEYYKDILLDESFQKSMFPANANPGIARMAMGIQNPMTAIDCEMWETPLLTAAQGIVMDRKNFGMLCVESNEEFFEGRLIGSPDTEILALRSEVLAAIFPKAAAVIQA